MAKPHKQAGRTIRVVSKLPADQLAALCKQAADENKLRLEQASTGLLAFSMRGSFQRFRAMDVEVRLASEDGAQAMVARIASYKTRQQKLFGLVPLGPRKLVGIAIYERFLRRFGELAQNADPTATVAITG